MHAFLRFSLAIGATVMFYASSLADSPKVPTSKQDVSKSYRLKAEDIKPIAIGRGSCIASDRITVDGELIRYMYREEPDDKVDSGWRFFAGDETQDYADDADNFAMYDVNTIANYDPRIVGLLDSPAGSAFEWSNALDGYVAIDNPTEAE